MSMRNLKELRENYNTSLQHKEDEIRQDDIAQMTGVGKSAISKLENVHRKPTPDDLLAYSRLCHVSLEYILDDTVTAKNPKNATISKELGITDAVADTMKEIKSLSSKDLDYTSVLNAFIGNGENTFYFISQLFSYLLSEHVNGKTATMDALMISNIMAYIDHFVRPQLEDVLNRRKNYEEELENYKSLN